MPDQIVHWRNAYESGFAKGKTDRREFLAWRELQIAEEREQEIQEDQERGHGL